MNGTNKISGSLLVFVLLISIFFCIVSCNSSDTIEISESLPDPDEVHEGNNYQGLRFETINLDNKILTAGFPKIVCFGDSVTFGWNIPYPESYPMLLQKKLKESYPEAIVINSGIGGDTTIGGLVRLQKDVLDYNPDIIIINLGLNDGILIVEELYNEDKAYDAGEEKIRSMISEEDYKLSYKSIIDIIEDEGTAIIIMSTNQILKEVLWEDPEIGELQIENYKKFNRITKDLSGRYGLEHINLWQAFGDPPGPNGYLQKDGIHPNRKGLALIAEMAADRIHSLLDK